MRKPPDTKATISDYSLLTCSWLSRLYAKRFFEILFALVVEFVLTKGHFFWRLSYRNPFSGGVVALYCVASTFEFENQLPAP
jgi:hypothetical protein